MLSELLDDMRGLHRELSCGYEHKSLDLVLSGVNLLDDGDRVGGSLSSTILGSGNDVLILKCQGDCLLLYRRRALKSHFIDTLIINLRIILLSFYIFKSFPNKNTKLKGEAALD